MPETREGNAMAFDDWVSVRSTPGGFRATFPNQPEGTTESTSHEGEEVKTTLWTSETDDYACTVGIVEFGNYNPATNPRDVLDGALSGVLAELDGEVTESRQMDHDGKPALNAVVKFDEGFAALRMVSFGPKLYYAQVLSEEMQPEIFDYFADSLALLEETPA